MEFNAKIFKRSKFFNNIYAVVEKKATITQHRKVEISSFNSGKLDVESVSQQLPMHQPISAIFMGWNFFSSWSSNCLWGLLQTRTWALSTVLPSSLWTLLLNDIMVSLGILKNIGVAWTMILSVIINMKEPRRWQKWFREYIQGQETGQSKEKEADSSHWAREAMEACWEDYCSVSYTEQRPTGRKHSNPAPGLPTVFCKQVYRNSPHLLVGLECIKNPTEYVSYSCPHTYPGLTQQTQFLLRL